MSSDVALRVLFVNENIGGHATVHHHLRESLKEYPHIEAIFLDVPAPGLLRRILGASIPILGTMDLDLQPLRAQLALSAWVRLRLRSRIGRIDAVHFYTQNAALLSIDILRRVPSIVSTDTTNAHNAYRLPYRRPTRATRWTLPLAKLRERQVFRRADRVFVMSQWARRSLVDDYGFDPSAIDVVPFGIAGPPQPAGVSSQSSPAGTDTSRGSVDLTASNAEATGVQPRPTVVFIGRQFRAKGGDVLLDAWSAVADRAELVLITQEPPSALPDRVRVISDLSQGDPRLWDVLATAQILAFPSPIDQAPNAVLEAMAAGLAVVAPPHAAMTEMIVDGVTGRHVGADDREGWAQALAELIDDPVRCQQMGEAGRARFEDIYQIDVSTRRIVRALEEITGYGTPGDSAAHGAVRSNPIASDDHIAQDGQTGDGQTEDGPTVDGQTGDHQTADDQPVRGGSVMPESTPSAAVSVEPPITRRWRGPASALRQLTAHPLGPQAAQGAVILGYHDVVAGDRSEPPAAGFTVTAAQLDTHLGVLRSMGLQIVSLDALIHKMESGADIDRLAVITFDDALIGVHRHGLDVLDRHGATATIFTVARHRGVTPPWWPEAQRTMTEPELHDVIHAGHHLGSHTVSHRSLPQCSTEEYWRELDDSRQQLHALSGQPIDHLAYPSGHYHQGIRDAAAAIGYRSACTYLNGRITADTDRFRLPRLTMGAHMTRTRLMYHLLRHPTSWPPHQRVAVD